MLEQRAFRLILDRLPGESLRVHREKTSNLNNPSERVTSAKLFADLLKRISRRVMADVTECPPNTLPAHLARLDDWRELMGFALRHELVPGADSLPSGGQLLRPSTVADFVACLEITRRDFRAPAFINQRDGDLAEINRKLDLLAGLFAASPALNAVLNESLAADTAEEMGVTCES